jgi:hypothetical protein
MTDLWSNWIFAIAALKHLLIDTAVTALPLAEAVADPESALLAHKDQGNIIKHFRFNLTVHLVITPLNMIAHRKC